MCICCFSIVVVFGFQRGFPAEFRFWLLYLLVVVVVVGFCFGNLIGFHFFRFRSGIGLLSFVCGNRICLCYSFVYVDLSVGCQDA